MKAKQVLFTSILALVLCMSTNAWAAEAAPAAMAPAPAMEATMAAPMAAPAMAAPAMEATMAAPMAVTPVAVPVMAAVPATMEPMAIATPVAPMEPVASDPVESTAPEKPMDATPVASATGMAATVATMDASPAQAAAPKVSTDSKAVLWLGVITVGLLGLLGLLGGFGLLNWTKKERALKIMKIADKILDGLAVAAKATSFKWDDALVTMLHDIDTRLIASGEKGLADAEKDAVKKIAETRKDQVLTEPAKVEAKKD